MSQPGWDVKEAVAQRFRLTRRQRLRVSGQCEEPGPCGQVGSDLHQHQPHPVDLELPRREPPQPRVLGVPDPVLDPSVRPMPGLEESQLSGRGVGELCLFKLG